MSVFQLFWNLILGISGGIISGIIVSRIFLSQGDFQNQMNSFDLLLLKIGIYQWYAFWNTYCSRILI